MKKARKLLVALLVLTFVMSTFSVGFAAEEAEKLPADVVRAQALGILKGDDQGRLNLDKPITRAEALALIVRISGLEKSADLMSGQTQFADANVDPSLQWATGYINLGVGQNIINGYPDGTFKGNAEVTFAEMAKMLLYAMNYGVTVEGGQWPAAVMGKADDLKVFDKVNALPNIPALRGDVVKMIDNSLTVNHLKQTGYGDFKQYEEDEGKTFLSKLDVTELKDVRVTAVDPKKAKITIAKKSYKVLAEVDVESLLGMEVKAWANDDDEIFFIAPDMDAVKVDLVKEDVGEDATKIKLKLADASYKVADDLKVYINGELKDLDDLNEDNYGYFIFDEDDHILYVNVKAWNEVNAGVVTKVDTKDNLIYYFLEDDNYDELDLDDPDDGYVISLDGKPIELEDIEASDVIYVAEYDDMYHIVVVRDSVEGELEKAKDDKVTIDGKTYKVVGTSTYSTDEDKNIALINEDANNIKDMVDEDVLVILNIAGELRHITSDVETTSDTFYGILTKVDDYNEAVRIYANGSFKSYDIDGKIYKGAAKDDDKKLTFNGLKEESTDKYAIVKFALNKDGEIEDLFVLAIANEDGKIVSNEDYADDVIGQFLIKKFDDKHDTIKTSDARFFITSTTVIIDEIDDIDEVEWDDIKDKEIDIIEGTATNSIIVKDNKDNAKLIIFEKGHYEKIAGDKDKYAVVLDKYYKGGDWKIKAAVHDDDEVEFVLKNKNVTNIGEAISFRLTSKDKIDTVAKYVYGKPIVVVDVTGKTLVGEVQDKDGDYIKVDDTYYRVDSLTLVYDVTDGLNKIEKASYGKVREGKNVALVVDGRAVKILYILPDDAVEGKIPEDKVVKAVNEAEDVVAMRKALRSVGYELYDEMSATEQAKIANKVLGAMEDEEEFADRAAIISAIDNAIFGE